MRVATITIPQPCAESWAAMSPTATGRHCAACQKTVVDFTQKTDAEILAHLARTAGGGVCGRFQAGQVGRPLQPPTSAPSWRSWLSTLLTVGSLSVLPALRSAGQAAPASYASGGPEPTARPATVSPSSLPPVRRSDQLLSPVLIAAAPAAESLMLRGVVCDADTKEAIPGATVLIKGTLTGTSTNAAGEFELPLAPGSQQMQLRISSVGYETIEETVTIAPGATSASLALTPVVLQASVMMLGEMIGVPIRPFPWHPRAFWFWLTRPLRRY